MSPPTATMVTVAGGGGGRRKRLELRFHNLDSSVIVNILVEVLTKESSQGEAKDWELNSYKKEEEKTYSMKFQSEKHKLKNGLKRSCIYIADLLDYGVIGEEGKDLGEDVEDQICLDDINETKL
ncbi:hypothetical protein LXL04_023506 [Taraxacum kok-saghyz]